MSSLTDFWGDISHPIYDKQLCHPDKSDDSTSLNFCQNASNLKILEPIIYITAYYSDSFTASCNIGYIYKKIGATW